MEKDYSLAEQYPLKQPSDGAYPPAYPPSYQSIAQSPPSAPYPDVMHAQPPPYDPGVVQQQQANTVVLATAPQPFTNVVKPPNYLAMSLTNLLCCCWLLGIIGLIYSLKVDSEFNAGRYEEARRASDSARRINYIGIAVGASLILGYIVMAIVINVVVVATNSSS